MISIIALLIALLLPAIKKAKDVAQMSVCLSNLRQQGIAVAAYQSENNGFFPPSFTIIGFDLTFVYERLEYYDLPKVGNEPDARRNAWICPADPLEESSFSSTSWWHFNGYYHVADNDEYRTSYAYNSPEGRTTFTLDEPWGLYDITDGFPRNITAIEQPSRTLLFVEASINPCWSGWISAGDTPLELFPFHQNGLAATLSAVDGHAEVFSDLIPTHWSVAAFGLPEYWYRIDQ